MRALFLEKKPGFDWHPGMLIEASTLQNPFLADLVSLADPRSEYSYLNYCKQTGRIYSYYMRENHYLSRAEYNRYCQWWWPACPICASTTRSTGRAARSGQQHLPGHRPARRHAAASAS